MKTKTNVPAVFTVASSALLLLGVNLLATKTTLHPQFFITTCGEVLKNIRDHVHFNPEGVISSLILLIAFVSLGLTLRQVVRFLIAYKRVHRHTTVDRLPNKLKLVMRKYKLNKNTVLVIAGSKLSAYTIGLFKPRIVISQSLVRKLTEKQLEAVILHELYHLKRRHILWLLFSRLVSSLFFFIPLIEYLARQLKIEFELAADAFVVENQKTRNHLCSSLALNLQYASKVVPHFATSPIERRVESLVGNELAIERIGMKPLVVSILSIVLMLGIAFVQPTQAATGFTFESGGVCSVQKGCENTDCSGHESRDTHNFSPAVPASFSLISSH